MKTVFLTTDYVSNFDTKKTASLKQNPFAHTVFVMEFPSDEHAQYFVDNWKTSMHDYKEACMPGQYQVITKTPFNGKWITDDFYVNI